MSIHPELRRQNTAVPGTVEQGKSSFLVASVAEDLRRERCAVIVLDPKGDAAEAAVSLVPEDRTCTLLDFAHPTCGFNPLAVEAPADVIADYVVAALRNLFCDADIRASSDRYLRNAIIAVLAARPRGRACGMPRGCCRWARRATRFARAWARACARLPEFKEISEFFTAELTAQLADARSTTTAKLDAPGQQARPAPQLGIDQAGPAQRLAARRPRPGDRRSARCSWSRERWARWARATRRCSCSCSWACSTPRWRASRTSSPRAERVAVALKIDEAPLVVNRGFAETMALKRSAGLETVACWQTDAQWVDREVRDQLDALFAHRVYFATASVRTRATRPA